MTGKSFESSVIHCIIFCFAGAQSMGSITLSHGGRGSLGGGTLSRRAGGDNSVASGARGAMSSSPVSPSHTDPGGDLPDYEERRSMRGQGQTDPNAISSSSLKRGDGKRPGHHYEMPETPSVATSKQTTSAASSPHRMITTDDDEFSSSPLRVWREPKHQMQMHQTPGQDRGPLHGVMSKKRGYVGRGFMTTRGPAGGGDSSSFEYSSASADGSYCSSSVYSSVAGVGGVPFRYEMPTTQVGVLPPVLDTCGSSVDDVSSANSRVGNTTTVIEKNSCASAAGFGAGVVRSQSDSQLYSDGPGDADSSAAADGRHSEYPHDFIPPNSNSLNRNSANRHSFPRATRTRKLAGDNNNTESFICLTGTKLNTRKLHLGAGGGSRHLVRGFRKAE